MAAGILRKFLLVVYPLLPARGDGVPVALVTGVARSAPTRRGPRRRSRPTGFRRRPDFVR